MYCNFLMKHFFLITNSNVMPTLRGFGWYPSFGAHSGWLRLYKIFQEAAPPVSDLRLMCHLLNNCSLYMSIIFIYFLSIYIGNN